MSNALIAPFREALVMPNGRATKALENYLTTLGRQVPSYSPLNVLDFGASGGGVADDTEGIQKAILQAVDQGGAIIIVPPGEYSIDSVEFPVSDVPITLLGFGASTIFRRRSTLSAGVGLFDIFGSNVTFGDFLIDGAVTVPVGIFYNNSFLVDGNNDPMAPVLTLNSSIWLHGGANGFNSQRIQIQHTGGYAILIDSRAGGITDVRLEDCRFRNNRPHLFGLAPTYAAIYGSWTGGVFVSGDGRASNPGCVLKRFFVTECQFTRSTGNMLWSHLLGLDELHESFHITDNFFEDIGLDGIEIGGVVGGVVDDNELHRIGYITLTDTDSPVPRWLPNAQATAIDSSGLVIGVNYQGNSITSANGGGLDLDGHSDSSLMGNTVRIPVVGDPDYVEDSIAISGYLENGSTSYGVNLGNTANDPRGGKNVAIIGNTLLNLMAGSIRLYSARNCLVMGNNIVVPSAPISPPIAYGPGGSGVNQAPTGNVIKHNRIQYAPAVAAPVVYEDASIAPFTAAMINYVFGNCPILDATGAPSLATEFDKDVNSGSPEYLENVWFT